MVPVEAMNTSSGLHPTTAAALSTVRLTDATPARPVKALELPEFTTRKRAEPPLRASRHHRTGAEAVSERVNTPATAVPGANSASIRSSRP